MFLEDNSVEHTLSKNGQVLETATSGFHMELLSKKLAELCEKYKDECKAQYDKYFGPETEYGKAETALSSRIANKKPEEQTAEDKAEAERVKELYREATSKYINDPDTIRTVSVWTTSRGNKNEIFNFDLPILAKATKESTMTRADVIRDLNEHIFDLMRRSDLQLVAIATKFENEDRNGTGVSNHTVMGMGTPFTLIEPNDVDVLENTVEHLHDVVIGKTMREQLGFQKPPQIIT